MTVSRLRQVGRTHPVSDVAQKVTGELIYGSDMELPGMLHAKLLLSPIAHGRVGAIDASRAEALPGVVKVFSHLNAPSRPYCRSRLHPGQALCPEDETLFSNPVRFVGDRVAAVVATSRAVAEDAVALVAVEYEPLPALLTPDQALRETDVHIHPGGNLLFEHEVEVGEPPEPLPGSVVVTSSASTQRIHHAALEPHMCVAQYDRSGGLTIWGATQGVYGVRTVVADLLGLSYNRVRVIKVPMGGSFGGKSEFILEPLTAFLAMQTRRPVKLVLDREECMIATMTRPATASTIRTVTTDQGELRDVAVISTLDAGAYAASTPDYATAMCAKTSRLYRLPHYRHQCRVVYTNTPVAGAARGWGAPEILTAVEIHMDRVAHELAIDPVEVRRRNLVHPFDVDPVGGLSLGDARVRQCLEEGAAAFAWQIRRGRPHGRGRLRRGVGVACGAHKNGMFGAIAEASSMTLKMNEDGSFSLSASLHDPGCGMVTLMKVIVAEVLGVSPDQVAAGEADTATTPFDYGTYGSRGTYVCGACARATAEKLKGIILGAAADLLMEPQETVRVDQGVISVEGDNRAGIAYGDIARESQMRHLPDLFAATTYFASSNPGSYSVQFAEVEVDCATGLTAVSDFLAVADVGRAINRGMVEAQYQGAVQMGIGYALYEDLKVDETGRCGADGFKNYHVVNAPDMPDVRVLLVEHEGDEGPFGAKSVGEIAAVPTAAAVINAVNDALGTTLADLPATPEKVLAALAQTEREAR